MGTAKQKRSIELLTVLCTVFGAWVTNSYLVIYTMGTVYSGYEFLLIEILVLSTWYVIPALLFAMAHPSPSKSLLLILGTFIAILLLATSQIHVVLNPDLGWHTLAFDWLRIAAHFLVVIPVFGIVGYLFEKKRHAEKRDT